MSTTIGTASLSSAATISTSVIPQATQTLTPTPLIVQLNGRLEVTDDFFPFHDLAKVGGYTKDDITFKDLIREGIDGGQRIDLFQSGCVVDGHDKSDCSRACYDPTLFFGSLDTFYNCAALASIAYWTKENGTYYITEAAERNASSIMGSDTLRSFNGRAVLQSFVTCAKDACANDHLSQGCDGSIPALHNTSSTVEIFHAMGTFCPDISAEIDPDIFGPGVLISYVLQVCFSTSLYIFLKIFNLWVGYTQQQKEREKERRRSLKLKRSLTRIESMIWRDSSALSRTSIAIATTLVEFQEMQCWFVFAVQIASILAIAVNSQEGTFWGEIIVNGALAFHISQNGILPMFLVQICLHNEGIRNWHTFLGFAMEYLLAIVATTQKIGFKSTFNLFQQQYEIAGCGGNPSPRTYCASTSGVDGLNVNFFPHPLFYKLVFLVLDTVAMIVLISDQLAWTLRRHHRAKQWQVGRHKLGRWPEHSSKRYWIRFRRLFWAGLELCYLIVNVLYLVSLTNVIRPESFKANRWSYGQIIAMTVWGPVIVKLFDLILCKYPPLL